MLADMSLFSFWKALQLSGINSFISPSPSFPFFSSFPLPSLLPPSSVYFCVPELHPEQGQACDLSLRSPISRN